MDEHTAHAGSNGTPTSGPPAGPASAHLQGALNAAMASRSYVIAVWHVADGRLNLYRETSGFPLIDLSAAERLLHDDFLAMNS